jgi:nitrogen fixation NifU-like protein
MTIYIKVKDNRLTDIKFKTFGCGSAIATSSMITELAKGKTLEEAMKITRANVADSLGGLPPVKMHCSNLAADALHAAIEDYYKKLKCEEGNKK